MTHSPFRLRSSFPTVPSSHQRHTCCVGECAVSCSESFWPVPQSPQGVAFHHLSAAVPAASLWSGWRRGSEKNWRNSELEEGRGALARRGGRREGEGGRRGGGGEGRGRKGGERRGEERTGEEGSEKTKENRATWISTWHSHSWRCLIHTLFRLHYTALHTALTRGG